MEEKCFCHLNGLAVKDAFARKRLESFVFPEMYGAKGDGVTDDTAALQACIDDAIRDNKTVILAANAVYLINSVKINAPIVFDGNGATLKANTAGSAMMEFNFLIWNPGKWSRIENITFDMADIAHIGLKIINTRIATFQNLYFNNFDVPTATNDNKVAAIYEKCEAGSTGVGYERYFNNIVFHSNIGGESLNQEYVKYIRCVLTESAGDDVWTNIVSHSTPYVFDMYNWTTVLSNIHACGDSSFTVSNATAFTFRSTGPYIMNNIYIDSSPYGFAVHQNVPVLADNVTVITVEGKESTLFYLTEINARHALTGISIKNLHAKYNTIKLTDYNSAAVYAKLDIADLDRIINYKNAGYYNWSKTFADGVSGDVALINNYDGTWRIKGNVNITGDISVSTSTYANMFTLPPYVTMRENANISVNNADGTHAFNTMVHADREAGYLQFYDNKKTRVYSAGMYITLDIPVYVQMYH